MHVINALKMEIFNFFKKIIVYFRMPKEGSEAPVNQTQYLIARPFVLLF